MSVFVRTYASDYCPIHFFNVTRHGRPTYIQRTCIFIISIFRMRLNQENKPGIRVIGHYSIIYSITSAFYRIIYALLIL